MLVNRVMIDDGGGGSSSGLNGYTYKVADLLAVAKGELGYKEKKSNSNLDSKTANAGDGNWTKYARDLANAGYYQGNKNGYAWCDVFVDWCFYKLVCNVTGKSGKDVRQKANELICVNEGELYGAGCGCSRDYYKAKKRLGNLPVKGAQIFFYDDGVVSHTGIVTGYDNSKVYTIEGNASNQVKECSYSRSSSRIVGYGYPKLTGLSIPSGSTVPPDPPSSFGEDTSSDDESSGGSSTGSTSGAASYNGLKYSDSNPPLYCPQTQSTCYKGTGTMEVKGVLWHSTGCNNPNLWRWMQPDDDDPKRDYWIQLLGKNKYGTDWNHIYHEAGLNCWIGKLADGTVTTVQGMPWNYRPWGCGSGSRGSCNSGWIQFEICEDDLSSEAYFKEAYEEACQITAYLCRKFNLDPKGTVEYKGVTVPVILDHATSHKLGLGGNHGDIGHWFPRYGKSMETVREDVAALMQSSGGYIPVIKQGDIVTVANNAVSQDGQRAQAYITTKKWKVSEAEESSEYATLGERSDTSSVVLNKSYKKTDLQVTSAEGTVAPPSNTGTVTNEERIWNLLAAKVKDSNGNTNAYGVAGIMGNMMAESGLEPKNLQNSYEKSLTGKSGKDADAYYTAAVDNGTYTNFVRDSAGYGLVQWTYWSLKEELLNHAKSKNKSIGDLDMQVNFLCQQLSSSYKSVWNTCCNAKSVKEASDKVLHGFERPYGHDGVNKESQERTRAGYGDGFYQRHQGACTHSSTSKRDATEATCAADGYTGDTVCNSCGQTVEYGAIIPAKQHNLVNGVCSVCGGVPGADPTTGSSSSGIVDSGLVTRDDLLRMLELLNAMLKREGES